MISKDLVKAIRATKGPIYVAVCSAHDVYYIQAVKSDLVTSFTFPDPSEETHMEITQRDGAYYIDKDWNAV